MMKSLRSSIPKGMVHVHSFETGNRIIEAEIERPGSPSQVIVRRLGRRYIILSQGSAVRFPGFRDVPHAHPNGKIWAIDRETGKDRLDNFDARVADSGRHRRRTRPSSSCCVRRPGLNPPDPAKESCRSSMLRSGALLYDTAETTPPDRISVRLDRDTRQVTVTTDKCVLTISPTTGAASAPRLHEIRGKSGRRAGAASVPRSHDAITAFCRGTNLAANS